MSTPPGHGQTLGAAAAAWAVPRRMAAGPWTVRYREAGAGEPLVLVHGLGVSADYWIRNGPPLAAAGSRVLAPDLPGFGRTPGPRSGLTVPEQAAVLARWAEALDLGPATYVGHSLSCQSVLELAAREPERVRALVLIGPTGAPGWRMPRQAWRLGIDATREPRKLIALVGWAYLQAGPRHVWHTWRKGSDHDPLALLPRIEAPGLVLVGTRDPVVEHGFARALAAGLPRGRLVWLPRGTHAAQFGVASLFNLEVIRFLRSLETSPPAAPRLPTPAAAAESRGGR